MGRRVEEYQQGVMAAQDQEVLEDTTSHVALPPKKTHQDILPRQTPTPRETVREQLSFAGTAQIEHLFRTKSHTVERNPLAVMSPKRSLFYIVILAESLPAGLKVSSLSEYDESSNPQDHLDKFYAKVFMTLVIQPSTKSSELYCQSAHYHILTNCLPELSRV